MYAFVEGEIAYKTPSLLYVVASGVGYEVNITLQTYSAIQALNYCRLFTHLQVREDAWVLYGFATEDERATFRQLLNISGVGAATARIILSSLTTDELARAVNGEDARTLERVKGIGSKTAQRIILELKGKLIAATASSTPGFAVHNTSVEDALIALVNLGINKSMADAALKKVPDVDALSVEQIIKQALKNL